MINSLVKLQEISSTNPEIPGRTAKKYGTTEDGGVMSNQTYI